MDSATLMIVLVATAGFTIGTGYVADRKGRSFLGWAVVGFFFGLIGLLVAALVPAKHSA